MSSASFRSIPFLSFIKPIFAWNVPLVSLIFLKRSLVFPILLFSSIYLHWSLRKTFLSLLAILWNSAFRCLYLSFSPLVFASLLFTAICKASSDSLFAFFHFFNMLLLLLLLSRFSHVPLCATPETAATRLPRPWDSPGKSTGVGCHFPLQCMKVQSENEVAQSCPIPSDLMDCSLPGSSVHRIFQARVLEWVAIAFSGWEAS